METSRTHNVMRNISWAVLLQILLMLLQFFARTVFIRNLGKDYLGITGLFTDIMSMLGIANLGIPDVIIISMYKPLAEKNYEKVRALLHLFRKASYISGLAVLIIGLILIPMMHLFIKNPPNIPESFRVIYLFYLAQSVVTYFIIYKRTIIFANQKDYIINIYAKVFNFLQIILQIVVLLTIKNFYLFLFAQVLCTLSMNYLTSLKAEKMYPFIKGKNKYKLNKEEISEIITNIKSMFIYVIGIAVMNGVDSILISSIVGIGILGLCSNYMLIINSVKDLVDRTMIGFTASIGNLNAVEESETIENVFNQVYFIAFAIAAFFAINLAVSLSSLISVWLNGSFLISQIIVISMALRFYILITQYVTFTFRSTLGLLKKIRYIPLVTAVSNIGLSILLGRLYGVSGIFFASSISILSFTVIPEVLLLYKNIFKKSSIFFLIRCLGYLLFIVFNYFVTSRLLDKFVFTGWIGFFLRAFIGAIISGLLFIIVFFRDKYFRALFTRLLYMIKYKNAKNDANPE